jgi:tetratricopeptide (TPR) repeat protein
MLYPSAYGRLPAHREWLAAFLLVLLCQRWVIAFLTAAFAFTLLTLFLPGLLSARPPASATPGSCSGQASRAPYLEKAFRLRTVGDLFLAANQQERAYGLYRRALAASMTHLEGETNAPLRLQVELGVALLQEKSGDADGATETLRKVISDAAGAPAAGVAHFYLGRIYEVARKDSGGALEHYEAALKYVTEISPLDALGKACELLTDTSGGSRTAYGIAGLTATHASASALEGDISKSIRRITGKAPDKNRDGSAPSSPAPSDNKLPEATADDPLVIVQGK